MVGRCVLAIAMLTLATCGTDGSAPREAETGSSIDVGSPVWDIPEHDALDVRNVGFDGSDTGRRWDTQVDVGQPLPDGWVDGSEPIDHPDALGTDFLSTPDAAQDAVGMDAERDTAANVAQDAADAGPACDPAGLEERCCCAYGIELAPRCGGNGSWTCEYPVDWTEGAACEGTPCGGPCGPPCPNVCDAPDTDPGCPAGFVAVGDGECLPRDCAALDADQAACTVAPVMIWSGQGSFPGDTPCEVRCGPDVPCRTVATWTEPIRVCFSADLAEINGLYRTEDAGLCWERVNGLDPEFSVFKLRGMVHVPSPDDAVLLFSRDGIRRSTDGGSTFTLPSAPEPVGLVAVHDEGVVYVIGRDPPREYDWQVWRSTDGGATFAAAAGFSSPQLVNGMAVHPADPDVLIITGRPYEAGGYYAAMRTADGGTTFDGVGPRLTEFAQEGRAVAFAPSQPSRAYVAVGGQGLYRSDDAGATWTLVLADFAASSLAVHPEDPDGLYSWGTISWDGGLTWSEAGADDTAAFFPDHNVVCPDDGGACDRWEGGTWLKYAYGDGPWRAAMGGLPWSNQGILQSRPVRFLPLGEGRALTTIETHQTMIF